MNKEDYIEEVERQLNDEEYYTKLSYNPSEEFKENISKCINQIAIHNCSIHDELDIFPNKIRTPQFYILPKIHKTIDKSLPLGYPGRPIISTCNSVTNNISKYIDHVLQPLMKSLPSYVKDTFDFIIKLKSLPKLTENSLLVTLDVVSLYTNIPHNDGIEACKYYLGENEYTCKLSKEHVCNLIKLVLENNFFSIW